MPLSFFSSSFEHLLTELKRMDALIKAYVKQAITTQTHDNPYPGLQVTAQEAQALLNDTVGLPFWYTAYADIDSPLSQFAHERQAIDQAVEQSIKNQISLQLIALQQRFQLTPQEIDILLICLTVEWDARYAVFFAYLHDDVNQKRPTMDLILNLLSQSWSEKGAMRRWLSPTATLRRYALIEINEQNGASSLSRPVNISERITHFLLGQEDLPAALSTIVSIMTPDKSLSALILPAALRDRLDNLLTQHRAELAQAVIYLQGGTGAGKRTLAQALCHALKITLLVVDLPALIKSQSQERVALILREAYLHNAAIYWRGMPSVLQADQQDWRQPIMAASKSYRGLVFMDGEANWPWAQTRVPEKRILTISLPPLTTLQRQDLWQRALPHLDQNTVIDVATRFRFSPHQIFSAAQLAKQVSHGDYPRDLSIDDVFHACKLQTTQALSTLARPCQPSVQCPEIILPLSCQQQLDELLHHVQYATTVYEHWGFARQLTRGKGLSALFSGTPGTGKTLAAEVVAARLKLTLYKIDLSSIVSKYIGETEKNLEQLFLEAEAHQGILFFDEADALFGKRSEVQNAHDRYANRETSYLLQKIEDYPGIVILATNFKHNIDEAFVRRLQFCIDFPFPTAEERLQIWQDIWPKETPLSTDINFSTLATLEIAGGHIKNIALAAAFKAASTPSTPKGAQVTLTHIKAAAQGEFKKIGKIIHPEQWASL